jgi:hypothetical protein
VIETIAAFHKGEEHITLRGMPAAHTRKSMPPLIHNYPRNIPDYPHVITARNFGNVLIPVVLSQFEFDRVLTSLTAQSGIAHNAGHSTGGGPPSDSLEVQ